MSARSTLRWSSITVETDIVNEHRRRVPLAVPEVRAVLLTESGALRSAVLDRADLLRIITSAATALAALDRAAAQGQQ